MTRITKAEAVFGSASEVYQRYNLFLVGKEKALRDYMGKGWALGMETNIEVTK